MTLDNSEATAPAQPAGWKAWSTGILLDEASSVAAVRAPGALCLTPVSGRFWQQLAVLEDGMVTWATLFTVLFFAVFAQMIVNVSTAVHEKIETQNAADATAVSGAVWMARSMNAVTAANHMMGELTALYTLHHAIGGEHLDEKPNTPNNTGLAVAANVGLDVAYNAVANTLKTIPVFKRHYDVVKKNPAASQDSTLYDAKLVLKGELVLAYGTHLFGAGLEKFPPTAALGIGIQAGALALQIKIWQEYKVLDALERVAVILRPIKRTLIPILLKAVWGYENSMLVSGPLAAHSAARKIATRHGMIGELTGEASSASFVTLPIEKEKTSGVSRSQLMRATYPWVYQWRKPLLTTLTLLCTLSQASSFYVKYTDKYVYEICEDFLKDKGYRLYVMKGLNLPDVDKSQETWATADGSAEAEQLFCYMGFVRKQKPPTVYSPAIFRQWNPHGAVAFSQSMIYNANKQQSPAPADGSVQPTAGWDTLNWTPGSYVVEYKGPKGAWESYFGSFSDIGDSFTGGKSPAVQLNWQAKLTPVTRRKLTFTMPVIRDSQIRKVMLQRASPILPATSRFLTH